ncbi:S41 family peptidase [Roseateles amylovorans]|uniref:Tricorn protease homolog n=1 Tax=Roseateles amylovorans TaxID=2978473 RepID=A0ABY6AUA5_9BURK|nr:S41 family peptidase [Roseateles amylovorans]UXH76801.1 PDZ domain-containing protein [Roseateles amylovorans]
MQLSSVSQAVALALTLTAATAASPTLARSTDAAAAPTASATLLLREPAVSASQLAFVYGGELWAAQRDGSQPRRLAGNVSSEFSPRFSPDGRWIAYSASHDGNTDVYVIAAAGGQPRRLTWHSAVDQATGWSPDGKRVLFSSPREVLNNRSNQLYEVPVDGGFEQKVMDAVAYEGRWSPDGKRLAYRPYRQAYNGTSGWRQSRGGTTPPIWIIDPKAGTWEQIPHVNATDSNPIWLGDEVVFISDRNDGAANLFAYHTKTKALRQLTKETVWDVRNVDGVDGRIVYEAGGQLKEVALSGGEPRVIPVALTEPSTQARVQWKDASKTISSVALSATGKRALISARGEVFTVPVKDGVVRNLTQSSGVREKDALWSPDGQQVAYVSDEPGTRHQIVIRDQLGDEAAGKPIRRLLLPETGYYTLLDWSPDGARLVLQDNHLNLYHLPLSGAQAGKLQKIDTSLRRQGFDVGFSPDSRWLAYTVTGRNHFTQIRIHDFQTGQQHTVTDGMSHAELPVFSGKGDVLYFAASINSGPTQVGLDMSTQERSLRLGLFGAVLRADGKSPLLPKAGDEEGKGKKGDEDKSDAKNEKGDKDEKDGDKKPVDKSESKDSKDAKGKDSKDDKDGKKVKPVRIDFAGLQDRIIGLPVAQARYDHLSVAADGALFYLERRQPGVSAEAPSAGEGAPRSDLYRFDFDEKSTKMVKPAVNDYSLSADGKKILLVLGGGRLEVADAAAKIDTKGIDLSGLRVRIDPRAEWKQIFDETWWMQKEFFYDPKLHGIDWKGVYQRYLPLLAHVQRREDLNQVLVEMIGELQVGHNRVGGGDVAQEPRVPVGLLGADFSFEGGHYRIKKIFQGDRWNPFLKAPLAAPGLGVKEGDFLMAVNGQPVDAGHNLYQQLENTVGKPVQLTVASDAQGRGARQVQVEPIANESALRQWAWIDHNRQEVDRLSGGKIAYVYMPDTAAQGFQHFNRMFFAQVDKPGLIVDDRRNGGGQAANYVTEVLGRQYLGSWKDRDALVFDTPGGAIYGPKAMLVDQDAGSGGDFMPYAFKRTGLGPLIGKRTWGGLIGIAINPSLIDGGQLVVPYFRFFTPEGEWRIENEGVAPDIEVDLDPVAVNAGRDVQLEAAVANVLERLKSWKPIQRTEPPAMPTQLGK